MTTLAVDVPRPQSLGDISEHPVIATDIIYEGAAVGDNGVGYARPLAGGDKFLGFAEKRADNADGAAGAKTVRVRVRGAVQIPVSGAVITDVGQPVYASDDDTFVFLPTGGSFIGFVRRFVSSGVVIADYDVFNMIDPYGPALRETLTDNKTLDAEDSGKTFFMTADAKTVTLPSIEGLSGIRIVNLGAYGTQLLTIDLGANDMLEGADITAADSKGILNTKATAQRGDYVLIDYSDANGYVIRERKGVWAREA